MAPLSGPRNTPRRGPSLHGVSVYLKDGYTVYEGGIVCIDGVDGYAVPGAARTGLITAGVFAPKSGAVLNQGAAALAGGGTDGSVRIDLDCGLFDFDNDSGGGKVAQANIGASCYLLDDHTVSMTGSGHSVAGQVMFVNGDGSVTVSIGLPQSNLD